MDANLCGAIDAAEDEHLIQPCSEQPQTTFTVRGTHAFRPPLRDYSLIPSTLVSWISPTGGNSSQRTLLRPDMTYSPLSPPATVLRSFNGVYEGQLVYQIGKMAPLSPTYVPSQVKPYKSPPPRQDLSDLRLSASQRNRSCYDPHLSSPPNHVQGRSRPQTAPARSAAARTYGKRTRLCPTEGLALTSKPQPQALEEGRRKLTQRPASAMPGSHSHLKKASEALSQSLSQGLAAHAYVHRPSSPSFSQPLIPRSPPPTANELRARLIQSQERGPELTFKEKLAKIKRLLE